MSSELPIHSSDIHSPAIHWPAILQFAGEAELAYLGDKTQLQAHLDQSGYSHPQDRLIDSNGAIFELIGASTRPTHQHVNLAELLEIIRAHAAQQRQCCIAKLAAPTIAEAIRLVESLDSQ